MLFLCHIDVIVARASLLLADVIDRAVDADIARSGKVGIDVSATLALDSNVARACQPHVGVDHLLLVDVYLTRSNHRDVGSKSLNVFHIDAGYVLSTAQTSAIDQTLRVSLGFDLEGVRELFGIHSRKY